MAEQSIPGLGKFSGFLGNTIGEAAAFAAGLAIGPLLEPVLQAERNLTWSAYPDKPLSPDVAARLYREGAVALGDAKDESAKSGINPTRFGNLVEAITKAPGFSEALTMWRRTGPDGAPLISDDDWSHSLKKSQVDPRYFPGLNALKEEVLTPAQVALGIVRSLLNDPGLMPVQLDTAGGKVPAYPVSSIDALKEAAGGGINEEHLRVLVGSIGLPMSVQQAASAYFRGIIALPDYNRAILEGDTRPEWAGAILDQARQIITAHDWVELHLRGWATQAEMYAGTALHGMSKADTDWLFKVLGRPIPIHQITTGLARGGTYNGPTADIPEVYLHSLQESNQRPEWYNLSYANRFSYPSLFQLNALVKAQAIDAVTAEDWATKNGLAPEVVTALGVFWRSETGASPASSTKSATTSAVRAIQKAYVQGNTSQAEATAELTKLGQDAASLPALFTAWNVSKTAYLQGLSNVQIRNRFRNQGLTEAEAVALLVDRGLDAATATAYLTG